MWHDHSPFQLKPKHAQPRRRFEPARKEPSKDAPKGALQIIISIADQRVSLYGSDGLIARSSVSTGVPGHPTPLGIFSVISKHRWHRSNIYSAAPMPYMQRITWSGIALHAGVLPGYPASHGCIRLIDDFAIRLWHLTKRGTRVIIARDEVQPVEVSSPRLFAPNAKIAAGPSESSVESAPASSADGMKTVAAGTQSLPDIEKKQEGTIQVPAAAPAIAAPRKLPPISIFVSRKEAKLFVRQGFAPLFDDPVTIQNPELPLGTHVFTAMESTNDGSRLRWTVVSLPETPVGKIAGHQRPEEQPRRRKPDQSIMNVRYTVSTTTRALGALDRIDVSRDAIERISQLISAGSSLIISDEGISSETGADTDFIVLTR